MKNTVIWAIVILVVLLGVWWYMSNPAGEPTLPEEEEEVMEEDEEEEEEPVSVVINLSEQNDSGMSGTATLTELNGSTLVRLDLTGAPTGVAQPAHIHTGTCAEIGGIVYPLESPVNGISETTLDASLDAIYGQLPLALNIHQSEEEVDVYVACGDLL